MKTLTFKSGRKTIEVDPNYIFLDNGSCIQYFNPTHLNILAEKLSTKEWERIKPELIELNIIGHRYRNCKIYQYQNNVSKSLYKKGDWALDGFNTAYIIEFQGENTYPKWLKVCDVYVNDIGKSIEESIEEKKKRATLISASKDMLAVLENFVNVCENGNPMDIMIQIGECCKMAKETIKKAKGL